MSITTAQADAMRALALSLLQNDEERAEALRLTDELWEMIEGADATVAHVATQLVMVRKAVSL